MSDAAVIAALGVSGVDIKRTREVAHDFWFPDETSCRLAANLVHKPERIVVLGPVGQAT